VAVETRAQRVRSKMARAVEASLRGDNRPLRQLLDALVGR
jgi:hypothetical protein